MGRKFGWVIEDDSTVTRVSAFMVNEEKIGVFQDVGRRDWYEKLPENVKLFDDIIDMTGSDATGFLVISDRIIDGVCLKDSVIYRPPSLVVGVGLHQDTTKETIMNGITCCLEAAKLSPKSVCMLASIKKPQDVPGLAEAGKELGVDVKYVDRDELAKVAAPNPSETVRAFEGTASVSEAAAIISSGGDLVAEKQKFPPNLTIAIARMKK